VDRWVLSRLHTLIAEYRRDMDDYDVTSACRKIEVFVDDHLSNWYVRLNRRRFWKGDLSADKRAAYATLHTCLTTISQLISPVAPFFSEWLFRNLTDNMIGAKFSVHLTDLPDADPALMDEALNRRMDYAQQISSLVLSIRKKEKLRVRLPLRRILLPVVDDRFQADVELVKDLILAEVNVKDIDFITDTAGIVSKKAKPNFKTLGKRYGKLMKDLAAAVQDFDQQMILDFEKNGQLTFALGDESIALEREDLEILSEDIPGWQVATEGPLTVALDITLDDGLVAEGIARELVNRIQNMRKAQGLNVTDRIVVEVENIEGIATALAGHGDYIRAETLADSLIAVDQPDGSDVEWLDGSTIRLRVARS
jgi:isoleucyl-tRNA synthetase